MDANQIQALINFGYGLTTPFLGRSTQWYRPENATIAPISQSCLMGSLSVRFDTDPAFSSTKPPQYGKGQWYALYDRSNTLVGDYLVSDQGTFFINGQFNLLPTQVVQCNRTVTIERPVEGSRPSFNPASAYGGDHTQTDWETIFCQFPASILTKSRGENGNVALATEVKLGTYEVLLPNVANTPIWFSDRLTDDLGQIYSVSSNEQTPFGWRLLAVATEA